MTAKPVTVPGQHEAQERPSDVSPASLTPVEMAALLWRHEWAMGLVNDRSEKVDGLEMLLTVVAPGPELLELSLAAARTVRREDAA